MYNPHASKCLYCSKYSGDYEDRCNEKKCSWYSKWEPNYEILTAEEIIAAREEVMSLQRD